jgi:hypothetical protein
MGESHEVGQYIYNSEAKLDQIFDVIDETRARLGKLKHEARGKERKEQEIPNNEEEVPIIEEEGENS